jgi:hypothetical protein
VFNPWLKKPSPPTRDAFSRSAAFTPLHPPNHTGTRFFHAIDLRTLKRPEGRVPALKMIRVSSMAENAKRFVHFGWLAVFPFEKINC